MTREQITESVKRTLIQHEKYFVEIVHLNGISLREGAEAKLGKRFVCAERVEIVDVKDGKKVVLVDYLSGTIKTKEGEINLGCGSELLFVKVTKDGVKPKCCEMNMSLLQPKILPSAD